MIRTTLDLNEETVHVLKQLASQEGKSQGEVIHEALLTYQTKTQRPMPKGIGKYDSGRSDISERAEEFLFQTRRAR
jgi:Ribbon-helix-helix protein, copG family